MQTIKLIIANMRIKNMRIIKIFYYSAYYAELFLENTNLNFYTKLTHLYRITFVNSNAVLMIQ